MTDAKQNLLTEEELKSIPVNLSPVYKDKNGNVFCQFKNAPEMTYKRFFSATIHDRFIRMGFTDSYLTKIIDLIINLSFDKTKTEQELREAFGTIGLSLRQRHGYVTSEDPFLRLACVYFVLPDEPLDECNDSWTDKKIALWNSDPDAKDFFLQKAFESTMKQPGISIPDMKHYFEIAEQRESNIPTLPKV